MNIRTSLFQRCLVTGFVAVISMGGQLLIAQGPVLSGTQAPAAQLLAPQQLDSLVAPIALYSDPLLSQVLVACTYPLEIVEAQQWLQNNRGLDSARLMDAARQQNWDPSVQALVAFPDVLGILNQDIRWTTDLGNAFLSQQSDVMSAVQRMRASARANGKLTSTPQQVVTTASADGQSAIEIEPASPDVIYVPTYDPMYIWGPPPWGAYPALYYPSFGFGFDPGLDIALCFGGWGWGGWGGWGWTPNWFGHGIFVNHTFFHNHGFRSWRGFGGGGFNGRGLWAHDPAHRLGVPYPNRQLAQRFQAASRWNAGAVAKRDAFGQSVGSNRVGFQGAQTGGRQFGARQGAQTFQRFGGASSAPGANSMRSFNGGTTVPGYRGAPAARGFSGGGSVRSFGGGARVPSYSGSPAVRGFGGGGSPPRSFGGGGGVRSFGGGGGARNFGGGGSAGGGFHGGGGGGGRRR